MTDPTTEPQARKPFGSRADYRHFLVITTRWMDNDLYGHVNNVVYYSYFDTVVNQYLIEGGFLNLGASDVVGLVVETGCRYAKPIAFPDQVTAGLRVARLGGTSVRYEVGLFRGDDEDAAAEGHFIHVYVDRATRRPTPLPETLRGLLMPLLWTAVSFGLMGIVNPLLQKQVDWPWFIASQFVFGVAAAIVVDRSEKVYIPPAGRGPDSLEEFVAGSEGDRP